MAKFKFTVSEHISSWRDYSVEIEGDSEEQALESLKRNVIDKLDNGWEDDELIECEIDYQNTFRSKDKDGVSVIIEGENANYSIVE